MDTVHHVDIRDIDSHDHAPIKRAEVTPVVACKESDAALRYRIRYVAGWIKEALCSDAELDVIAARYGLKRREMTARSSGNGNVTRSCSAADITAVSPVVWTL